jgi:hypothetical protein
MVSMLIFPLHLAGLQMLKPVLTFLFDDQKIPLFDFSTIYL